MKKITLGIAAILLSLLGSSFCAAETNAMQTPVGYWKTIDDVTGKPKSIIHIWKTKNDILVGKVIKIFPKQGEDQHKLCTACTGDRRNQPIVGMVILSGLQITPSTQWDNGNILDPENGKEYSCSMRMADNGNKLDVHGYIGIPLLGRSQTWERVDSTSDKIPA